MKKVLLIGLCAGLLLTWWRSGDAPVADSPVSVVDQIWIDRMPKRDTDKINLFAMIDEAELGIFDETSQYEGFFSLFAFHSGSPGKIRMLQAGTNHKLRYKMTNRGCEPFDFCLTIEGAPLGPKRYGTMRGWRIEGRHPGQIRQQVQGLLRHGRNTRF